eukprot:6947468-Alexandrium_andersonii.AAC.1
MLFNVLRERAPHVASKQSGVEAPRGIVLSVRREPVWEGAPQVFAMRALPGRVCRHEAPLGRMRSPCRHD